MTEPTYSSQSNTQNTRSEQSSFIESFMQVTEGRITKRDQREQESVLRIFQRKDEKKSLDQLVDNEITHLVKNSTTPVLILPRKHQMYLVENICFVGNSEGLSDHPLLHKIIAHFLPKPHRIKNGEMELIHWNNVFQIPNGIPIKHQFTFRQLNHLFKQSNIHMAVLPIPRNRPWWRSLWEISFLWNCCVPVLVIPI